MRCLALAGLFSLLLGGSGMAQLPGYPAAQPWALCRAAILSAEHAPAGPIPEHLMAAIGRVESGRRDPQTGRSSPWPWTINAEGQGFVYQTKAEAVAAVRALQARGVRSIDVGCMQINLMHHPAAFGSLDQAFDPQANAAYAARFLNQLHDQTGDWPRAAGMYHSATPELGAEYERHVLAIWQEEKQYAPASTMTQLASAWRSTMSSAAFVSASPTGSWSGPPGGRSDNARIIPLGSGLGSVGQGRGLDAYRTAPIALASRFTRSPGG